MAPDDRTLEALSKRFWQKVDKQPSEKGCWLWMGRPQSAGYGSISIGPLGHAKGYLAHRISYMIAHGIISDEVCVLHNCDTPPCVNPDHLFTGTKGDNIRDCVSKGRAFRVKGSSSPRAKLIEDQVNEMRELHQNDGLGYRRLANRYHVDRTTVRQIILRQTWKHV